LSLGVSGQYSRRDGFVHNQTNGNHPDEKESLAGRAQLRWTPTETLDFSLILHGQKFNDGFVPTFYRANDKNLFSVRRDYDGFVDTDTWGTAFKGSFENDAVKVTSISSYRNWKQDLKQDFDFSAAPVRLGFASPNLDQWSQELRVQSSDETKNLKWLGGLIYSNGDLDNDTGSIELAANPMLPPPPNTFRTVSDLVSKTYAVFGQATYTAWEKLDFTAGVRLTYDDRSADRARTLENPFIPTTPLGAWDGSDHFTDFSPKFGISYRCQPEFETYVSVSRGYQSGGFNVSNDSENGAKFDPSHSWNYEAGVKTKWLDERLLVNGAIFYIDSQDYQIYRINSIDPSQAFLVNADRVKSYGTEFDLTARPVTNLDLSAAFGVTETEFDDFTERTTIMTPGGPLTSTQNFDGNDVNFVPQFTASFAAQYRFSCGAYFRAEYQAIGDYYLDEANSVKQSAYGLFNARLGYQREHFEIYLFGKNLFDKHYVNNALDLRNSLQPDLFIRQPGDPRTFGIALSANF
jgi:iron complex outermembrane receptor protein